MIFLLRRDHCYWFLCEKTYFSLCYEHRLCFCIQTHLPALKISMPTTDENNKNLNMHNLILVRLILVTLKFFVRLKNYLKWESIAILPADFLMMFCILHGMRQKLNKFFSSSLCVFHLSVYCFCLWHEIVYSKHNRTIEKEGKWKRNRTKAMEKRWFYYWFCCYSNRIDCAKVISCRRRRRRKKLEDHNKFIF